jgi:hypothetical protein
MAGLWECRTSKTSGDCTDRATAAESSSTTGAGVASGTGWHVAAGAATAAPRSPQRYEGTSRDVRTGNPNG